MENSTPQITSTAPATATRRVRRLREGAFADVDDQLVIEEPLEIRVGDKSFTVTMRTPGNDFDLARGLLFTEGLIQSADDIGQMRYCDSVDSPIIGGRVANDGDASLDVAQESLPANTDSLPGGDGWGGIDSGDNLIVVRLKSDVSSGRHWQRNLMSGSSCGLCGKAALEAVPSTVCSIASDTPIDRAVVLGLPDALRRQQPFFDRTGGLHAAGIFTRAGNPLAVFEDIGRHNATDKAIGRGLAEGWLPSASHQDEALVLLVSGRASFEIVQKALVARIPIVASVSAASSLAVDLAAANNQTLIGFLRGSGMTVYIGAHRVG